MTTSFSTEGVRFKYFLEFIEGCGGEEALRGKTTSEVCEAFVKPRTLKAGGGSLCDLLRASEATSGLVAKSAWYISHAWSYPFLDVVEAVRLFLEDECGGRAGEEVVWFDVFSTEIRSSDDRSSEWNYTAFKDFIRSIGSVLMVMQPWDNPVTLTRAWCVFDAYACFVTGSRFEICMTRKEQMRFVDMIGKDPDCVLRMLGTVNSSKSSSRNPYDTEHIDEAIASIEVGLTTFEDVLLSNLKEYLNSWLSRLRDQTALEERKLRITTDEYASELETAMREGRVKANRARITLVGQGRAGKTCVARSFLNMEFKDTPSTQGNDDLGLRTRVQGVREDVRGAFSKAYP